MKRFFIKVVLLSSVVGLGYIYWPKIYAFTGLALLSTEVSYDYSNTQLAHTYETTLSEQLENTVPVKRLNSDNLLTSMETREFKKSWLKEVHFFRSYCSPMFSKLPKNRLWYEATLANGEIIKDIPTPYTCNSSLLVKVIFLNGQIQYVMTHNAQPKISQIEFQTFISHSLRTLIELDYERNPYLYYRQYSLAPK